MEHIMAQGNSMEDIMTEMFQQVKHDKGTTELPHAFILRWFGTGMGPDVSQYQEITTVRPPHA